MAERKPGYSESKQRSQLRQFADLLPGTIFEIDEKGIVVYANRSGMETFGYNVSDIQDGLSCFDLLDPSDYQKAMANFASIAKTGDNSPQEYTARRKDGSAFPIVVFMAPIFKQGEHEGFRGQIFDITEFRQIQDDLRQSEEKYRLVVENASEGLIITGEGRIFFANPKACRLLGRPPDQLVGQRYSDFVHPDDAGVIRDAIRARENILPGNRAHAFSCRIINDRGEVAWVDITGVPIYWEGKSCWLNFMIDTTERRIAQEEAVLRAKLQAAVETAGAACHELNQPLQAVMLMADLMISQLKKDDPMLPRLERLRDQVGRMAKITNQLNRITSYKVKGYIGIGNILDLESSGIRHDEDDDTGLDDKKAG